MSQSSGGAGTGGGDSHSGDRVSIDIEVDTNVSIRDTMTEKEIERERKRLDKEIAKKEREYARVLEREKKKIDREIAKKEREYERVLKREEKKIDREIAKEEKALERDRVREEKAFIKSIRDIELKRKKAAQEKKKADLESGRVAKETARVLLKQDIEDQKKAEKLAKEKEEKERAKAIEKEKKKIDREIARKEKQYARILEKGYEEASLAADHLLFSESVEKERAEEKAAMDALRRKRDEEKRKRQIQQHAMAKFGVFFRRVDREATKQSRIDAKHGAYSYPSILSSGAPFSAGPNILGVGGESALPTGTATGVGPLSGLATGIGPLSGLAKGKDPVAETQKAMNEVLKAMQQDINPRIRRMERIATDPQGFIAGNMLNLLRMGGPYGAAITSAITAIIATPQVAQTLIRELAKKGLPLNDDWRRAIESEVDGFFDVQEKKKRLLGIDGFVVTDTNRYVPESGSHTYNSFENRLEVITSKSIGLAEKAVGIE